MPMSDSAVPEQLPILSRGRHRNPRKGACFMELVSYLAGEAWSDHPECTHPLVASVARTVNDLTPDAARSGLAPLIPSVIGLTSDDPRVDVRVALRCATTALPVAAMERQRALAVGVLTGERVLDELEGRPPGTLEPSSRAALDQVPHAVRWARDFTRGYDTTPEDFCRRAAPSIVGLAVNGIAEACIPDPVGLLHDLLDGVIADCRRLLERDSDEEAVADAEWWQDVCELTGAGART